MQIDLSQHAHNYVRVRAVVAIPTINDTTELTELAILPFSPGVQVAVACDTRRVLSTACNQNDPMSRGEAQKRFFVEKVKVLITLPEFIQLSLDCDGQCVIISSCHAYQRLFG